MLVIKTLECTLLPYNYVISLRQLAKSILPEINVLKLRLNRLGTTQVQSLAETILAQALLTSRLNFGLVRVSFPLMNQRVKDKKKCMFFTSLLTWNLCVKNRSLMTSRRWLLEVVMLFCWWQYSQSTLALSIMSSFLSHSQSLLPLRMIVVTFLAGKLNPLIGNIYYRALCF